MLKQTDEKEKKKWGGAQRAIGNVGDTSQAYPRSTTRCLGQLLHVFLAVRYQELLMIFHMNLSKCLIELVVEHGLN